MTYVEDNEWSAVASREGRDGFENTVLGSRSFPAKPVSECHMRNEVGNVGLRSVTGQEVVASLLGGQFADRREDTESVTSEHDDVLGLALDGARNASVGNKLDGVSTTGVLGDADIVVVGLARNDVIDDVLEDGTEADGIVDLGFLLGGKVNALGVAATLDVKDTVV
jgi:hypothetical protein